MRIYDSDILKKIGCTGSDMYAVWNNTGDDECQNQVHIDDSGLSLDDELEIVDNLDCHADYDNVKDDKYDGIKNYLHGDIVVYRTDLYNHATQCGVYDSTGDYRMQSARGCTYYPGSNGRSVGIAIPQCKMMNSTVIDWMAKQAVYRGHVIKSRNCGNLMELGVSRLQNKYDDDAKWLRGFGFKTLGTHVPFDIWTIVGSVYGKALRIWRGVAKLDWEKMPLYMLVTVSEIFETICPNCKWSDMSENSKQEWRGIIGDMFKWMNYNGLAYDLPDKEGCRYAFIMEKIMDSSWVERRDKDGNFRLYGFKVKIRRSPLFEFCWRKGTNSPSVVQIRPYDYNIQRAMGSKRGWKLCFHSLWLAWLIQYRNYWKKRGGVFKSCQLVWSQKEMQRAFDGSFFSIRPLSSAEMEKMLAWHTVDSVTDRGDRRPAHILTYRKLRRCVFEWEMPLSNTRKSVLLKMEDGMNIAMEDSGISEIPEEVKVAKERMDAINDENVKHVVTLNHHLIGVYESVIYRSFKKEDGSIAVEEGVHGRCYTRAGGVQGLHKEQRGQLKIDGHSVKELDYSALHPTMMYSLRGIQHNGKSMYDVGNAWHNGTLSADVARRCVKMMLLRMVNADSKWKAIHSFKDWWNTRNKLPKKTYIPWVVSLYKAIEKTHKAIAADFCTGMGPMLMNIDGKLIREVCWRLTRQGICALAVHDSVVVDSRYANTAKLVMQEEYAKMFNGDYITVK